jgi:hypothetical protein
MLGVFGYTMGYWGNKNGQYTIVNLHGGYAANPVTIGRGAVIDTSPESLKVLPSTLNACGKGSPQIFTVGGSTATPNCSLATGININTLNTAASQTLALGYNIGLVPGFTGQTMTQLGVPAGYLTTAGLTATSTVNDAFATAVALINGSAAGGSTTQSQLGAMNTLLAYINRERNQLPYCTARPLHITPGEGTSPCRAAA